MAKGAGADAYAEHAARASHDQRDDQDRVFNVFVAALEPVRGVLQRVDKLGEAKAIDAAFRVTPRAYAELRACQNLRHANRTIENHAAIAKRVAGVHAIAKALADTVEKDGGAGTAEQRLLALAARYDWEAD